MEKFTSPLKVRAIDHFDDTAAILNHNALWGDQGARAYPR